MTDYNDPYPFSQLDAEDHAMIDTARKQYEAAKKEALSVWDEVPSAVKNAPEILAEVKPDPLEAVCPVTGMTYNRNLPRSPWVDEDGQPSNMAANLYA